MHGLRVPITKEAAGEGDVGVVPLAGAGPGVQQDGAQPEKDDLSEQLGAVNASRALVTSPGLALPLVGLGRSGVDRGRHERLRAVAPNLDRYTRATARPVWDAQAACRRQGAGLGAVPVVRLARRLAAMDGGSAGQQVRLQPLRGRVIEVDVYEVPGCLAEEDAKVGRSSGRALLEGLPYGVLTLSGVDRRIRPADLRPAGHRRPLGVPGNG